MGTIVDGNVFANSFANGGRRTAGAFTLLSQAPVASQTTDAVNIPSLQPQHRTADANSRSLFKNYPGEIVRKIRTDNPGRPDQINIGDNTGTLALRLTSSMTWRYANYFQEESAYESVLLALDTLGSVIQRSDYWTGGDDEHYDDITLYIAIYSPGSPGDPTPYSIAETQIARLSDADTPSTISTTVYRSASPITTGLPWAYNGTTGPGGGDYTDYTIYADFSNKADYLDLLGSGTDYTEQYELLVRHSDQSAQGLSAFPAFKPQTADYPSWGSPQTQDTIPTPKVTPVAPYTFTPDATWIGAGMVFKSEVSAQFVYTSPTSCDRRWFNGTEIKVKVKYKKAEVTRGTFGYVQGIGGFPAVIGSWASAGEDEKTISLPAYSSSKQTVGASWDLPEITGYIVAVDDIEITEVT
jgi:hypothetical protein